MTLGWLNRAFVVSDDQEAREVRTQRRLAAAIREMRAAIADVNENSVLVEIEPSAFEDFVHDQCPSDTYWTEKLSAALHG